MMIPSSGVHLGMGLSGADAGPLLRELLRRVNVEDSLSLIARASVRKDGQPYQLALVARYLLESEAERQGRGRALTEEELSLCCDLAASVVTSQGRAFGVEVSSDACSLAHRMAYQQLPDHEERRYVPRSLLLYRQIAPALQNEMGFHFEKAFVERYSLTLDDYWRIGYGLYKWSLQNPGKPFNSGNFTQYIAGQGRAESFLKLLACDYDAFRSMLDVPNGKNPHFEPYNLNPLRKLPLLRLSGDDYLVPVPAYLLRRTTHGLYYDLIELDRPGYISTIGRAFNAYIGRLLEGQHVTTLGGTDGQPWIVRDSDTAIVVRPITRPFGALSRATGDYNHLRQDLARKGGVVDCVKELQDIKAGDEKTINLVVALEDFYLANGPFIRGIVSDELECQGRPRLESRHKRRDRDASGPAERPPMGASVQLAHVTGLESLSALSLKSGKSLCDLMREKVDRQEYNGTGARYLRPLHGPETASRRECSPGSGGAKGSRQDIFDII